MKNSYESWFSISKARELEHILDLRISSMQNKLQIARITQWILTFLDPDSTSRQSPKLFRGRVRIYLNFWEPNPRFENEEQHQAFWKKMLRAAQVKFDVVAETPLDLQAYEIHFTEIDKELFFRPSVEKDGAIGHGLQKLRAYAQWYHECICKKDVIDFPD